MSRVSEKQQMNVPIRTRNNEEVQTDVNLITIRQNQDLDGQLVSADNRFLHFVNQSWMMPFSDYYLLNQLNTVIQQLKTNADHSEEYKTRRIIDELARKIHGLLARQLRITSKNSGYYDTLLQKQKQLTRLQIKYGSFEKKIDSYLKKIQELQRQIKNLRSSLKIYQSAAEQNQIYKNFFRQMKQITINSKKITDIEKLLNEQINPKIKQFEINLAQISKNASRERGSKQKAAISKYAMQLDSLNKTKDLDWETLSNSAAAFYNGLQHLNSDDWIQHRINLSDAYNQLKTRHTAVISLVNKNIDQLLKKDSNFKNLAQVKQFIKLIEKQNRQGFETVLVNGWIGLGVVHCHRQFESTQNSQRLKSLILLFQSEMKRLIDRYPQLGQALSIQIKQFLATQISKQVSGGDGLNWIKQVLVRDVQVVSVDNVYNYYNKNDKQEIYYLKVLVKTLLQQLKRINNDHKIGIQLDQGILQLLRAQALDGVKVEDIIALFRPSARVCEVDVLVDRPRYLTTTQTVGFPLKQQKAVIVADTAHFAVNLQQGVPYRKQIPYQYSKSQVVEVPVVIQRPYAVPSKIVQQVIKYDQKINVVKVQIQQERPIQVIQQVPVQAKQQIFATEQVQRQFRVPYHTKSIQTTEVIAQKQIPKNVYKQISKVFKVQQMVPKVYKQPKYQIVQRPYHHVVVQKQIQFVQVQRPIIQRLQVAKLTQVLVDKPIYYPEHCDCQKPQAVTVQVQKTLYKQIPKQIIVQKCHFVQPNVEQKIVEVACHTQIPIFKQIIKQEAVFIEKVVPFRTVEQKLVVVDRQIPFFIQHFTPVQLVIQKPVIVRDIKHVPVQVQHPVPIYVQKLVPKIVQVFRDRIVQKIVQVPRVEIVQKIVQKIVTIPRIVQRIVTVTQMVQVPVFIQTPILQVVQIPVQKLVTDIQQRQKIIQVKTQVLKIQKSLQVVDKVQYQQVKKVIQVQPETYPEVIVQKLVQVIRQHPVQVYIDRFVDRVIHIKDIIPVEQRVQIPIQVQCPVQIITQVPVFYKQPVVQIDVQRVQRQKVVQLLKQTIRIEEVNTPIIQKQKQIIQLPGQTIILKQPELHIVQVQRQNIITSKDIQERPVQHYLDLHKAHVVDQQTFVIPQKQVCYLEKPYAVTVQKPVLMKHEEMVVVQRPQTTIVKARQGRTQQVIKVITSEKLVAQKQSYPQPIPVPQHHYHVLYEQLPPKAYQNSVMAIDEKVKTQQVTNVIEIQGANKKIITKQIQVPVYMQRIFQKILMLPQIVEIEKKVYMVEQINNLIAKEVNIETHYDEYKVHMRSILDAANDILILINQGKQGNTAQFKKKLNLFLQLLRNQSRIPKIVQTVKQVQVVRQRDRPVLVPVYDSQRQKVLHLIISDLVQGLKGLSKAQIQKRFSQRVRSLFAYQFGLQEGAQIIGLNKYLERVDKGQVQGKWKSWLANYDRNLPSTIPEQGLTEAENMFIIGYDSNTSDYATIKASLQKLTLIHKQRLHELERLRGQHNATIVELRLKIDSLEALLSTQRYYKDMYLNQLLKIKKMLQQRQYDQIITILETITNIKQQIITTRIKGYGSGLGDRIIKNQGDQTITSEQGQRRMSQLLSQITGYENQSHIKNMQIQDLRQQNQRLRFEIDQIKLNVPVWKKQSTDQNFKRYNQEWETRIKNLEQNHFLELNHLRQQLIKRLTDGSSQGSDQFAKTYDDLMSKYTQLSQTQRTTQNQRRNLVNGYEQKLKDLNKQLITIRRDQQAQLKKNQSERKRLIDDYERRLTSTSSNQQKQLRKQLENTRKNFENLQRKTQNDRKKLIEDYEKRMTLSANNQEKQLRRDLEQARRNLQNAQNEKKRMSDDFEAKLKSSSNAQERQLRKQLENLRRNNEQLQKKSEDEKKRLIQQYQGKLKSTGSAQQRQLRRQLDTVKRNYEGLQRSADAQKTEFERKIKQTQDDLDKMKSSRRSGPSVSSPEQSQELQILKDKIKKLEIQLDSSKKQVQSYQKSRLGQTTYTSGIKQSGFEGQFQSPQSRYRSSGPKLQESQQDSQKIKQQEQPQQHRSSDVQARRISKSGVRGGQKTKVQQVEQARSSSSRVSGLSEGTQFKTTMTMREFMDMKKSQEKDQIITLVLIKVIEKIQQEAEKGIINCYSPSNIYFTNFNPNNLDALIVRFGAPITNRRSKTDGLYLAPEVLRGEGTNLKSVVFSLAVIWDELIHYQIYYKTIADIENLSYEYKVRDVSLNPILRNTLFEMMSKDQTKRLEMGQARRRLSLQRYILSQGRGGTATSRVSTQSRRNV